MKCDCAFSLIFGNFSKMPASSLLFNVESQYSTLTAVLLSLCFLSYFSIYWLSTCCRVQGYFQGRNPYFVQSYQGYAKPLPCSRSGHYLDEIWWRTLSLAVIMGHTIINRDSSFSLPVISFNVFHWNAEDSFCISGFGLEFQNDFSCSNRLWWSFPCDHDVFGAWFLIETARYMWRDITSLFF